jgi:hypothetical protein
MLVTFLLITISSLFSTCQSADTGSSDPSTYIIETDPTLVCQAGIDLHFVVENSNYIAPQRVGTNGMLDFVIDMVEILWAATDNPASGDLYTEMVYYPDWVTGQSPAPPPGFEGSVRGSGSATVVLPFTNDKSKIQDTFDLLEGWVASTDNRMHLNVALEKVYNNMKKRKEEGSLALSLVVVVAAHANRGDAGLTDQFADAIKDMGGLIMVIGASSRLNREDRLDSIRRVASEPVENFFVRVSPELASREPWPDLPDLAPRLVHQQLLDEHCITIDSMTDIFVCYYPDGSLNETDAKIHIQGTGFDLVLDHPDRECQFIPEDSQGRQDDFFIDAEWDQASQIFSCPFDIERKLGWDRNNP